MMQILDNLKISNLESLKIGGYLIGNNLMQDLSTGIRSWLHSQKDWLQEAADRLLKNRELTSDDISDIVKLLKTDTGLRVTSHRKFDELLPSSFQANEIRLNSIGNILGIENLSPRKPLNFGTDNLVVIYGHNGSGKSSYSKIIKNISGKPRAGILKANVFQDPPLSQKCEITYSYASQQHLHEWHVNTDPIDHLRFIDFFDSEESQYYLNKGNPVTYTPFLVKMFEELAKCCDNVKQHLQDEQSKLISTLPPIPNNYVQIELSNKYNALKATMSDLEIQQLLSWISEDEAQIKLLDDRLKELDPAAKAKNLRTTKIQIDLVIKTLEEGAQSYCNNNLNAIDTLREDAKLKQTIALKSALIPTGKLEGIGSETWKAMWEAAKNYSITAAYPSLEFPVIENAQCVLCHQELSLEAQSRLQDFEKYVQGKLESDAKKTLDIYQKALTLLPTIPSAEEIETSCQAADLSPDWKLYITNFWNSARPIRKVITNCEPLDKSLKINDISEGLTLLKKYSESIKEQVIQFDKDAQAFNRGQVEKDKLNLEAKKWISQQAPHIKKEIERLKSLAQYEQWISQTNSRSISTKASSVAEAIITQAYVSRFNEELKNIGAGRLKIELIKTKTHKGSPLHGLQLKSAKNQISVESILSEGERRIIALAAFLADVTDKPYVAPFVFDDPISSLDQTWEEKTIERLVLLSQTRQVIVFTHRLSMLGMLTEKADKIHTVHIRQEPWGAGETGEVPLYGKKPVEALTDLKNKRLVHAKKEYETNGRENYYPLAKSICSDFRILTERVVEYIFLADVVQRHRRAVNTLGKIHKLAKINTDDCDLIGEIMTKYSCHEHSQSLEAPTEIPEPHELEADICKLLDWHTEFISR